MSRPQRLKVSDARRASRLLCEIVERRHDPLLWLRHMLNRLPALVGAGRVIMGQFGLPLPGIRPPGSFVALNNAWTAAEREVVLDGFAKGMVMADPTYRRVIDLPGRFVAVRRQDVATDDEWYNTVFYQDYMRRVDMDSTINARFVSPLLQRFIPLSLTRRIGEPQMTEHNVAILRFFGRELFRKLERDARLVPTVALSPRERQVLDLFRTGLTEKAIADRLELSTHTVHDYAKSLYKQFAVSTRAELLVAVHRLQSGQEGLRLPDDLPPGIDWGFNLGRAEAIPLVEDA